jgi:hypothetical protein
MSMQVKTDDQIYDLASDKPKQDKEDIVAYINEIEEFIDTNKKEYVK